VKILITFFWNSHGLEKELAVFSQYYNQNLGGNAPVEVSGDRQPLRAALNNYSWVSHRDGIFQTQIAA
jgi:hypothetical protein